MRGLPGFLVQMMLLLSLPANAGDDSVDKTIQSVRERLARIRQSAESAAVEPPAATVTAPAVKPAPEPAKPVAEALVPTVKTAKLPVKKKRAPASYRPPSLQQKIERKKHQEATLPPKAAEPEVPAKVPEGPKAVGPGPADPTSTVPTQDPAEPPAHLTGEWNGRREQLSAKGIDLGLVYKGEANVVVDGGLRRRWVYLENLDLRLNLDAEKMLGWKGASFFLYGLADRGGSNDNAPSRNIGDAQGTSNIETRADDFKLYEAWFQQLFMEDRLSVLAGLHDLNSEFYVTDSSGMFFNASFGVGRELSQTGTNGPSIFPVTAPAIRLRTEPSKSFYLQVGIFNAQAGDPDHPQGLHVRAGGEDGLLTIAEAAYLSGREAKDGLAGKYAVGMWSYTRSFDHLETQVTNANGESVPVQTASTGSYFLVDQAVSEDTSFFVRYGRASTASNPVGVNASAGIVTRGLIPGRAKDRVGIGITQVRVGNEFKAAGEASGTPVADAETTYELNYRVEIRPGLAVQPDLQYVVTPGFDQSIQNAQVGAFRIELSF